MRKFIISERSMAPALAPGDRILARRIHRPRRGEIVFFEHPQRGGFWLVKRLVGLPGESVTIDDDGVWVNGAPLDEPWALGATTPHGSWKVPSDHMYVLSDARQRTRADSRTFGPVRMTRAYRAGLRYRRGRV